MQKLLMPNRSVRLEEDLAATLAQTAAAMQRSCNWVVNDALRHYFATKHSEQARWQETLEAIQSIEHGNAIMEETGEAWLKSWGTADTLPTPK